MAFLLVAYALLIEALLLAMAVFGLFWAPFGALICARIAKPKGLPVARYAIKGLAYSMILFFPWVYLVIRMSGRHLPASCTSTGYIALYVCWFAILLVKTVPGSNALIGILQAMLLVVSIVQFYFIPSNNRMARADARFDELPKVYWDKNGETNSLVKVERLITFHNTNLYRYNDLLINLRLYHNNSKMTDVTTGNWSRITRPTIGPINTRSWWGEFSFLNSSGNYRYSLNQNQSAYATVHTGVRVCFGGVRCGDRSNQYRLNLW